MGSDSKTKRTQRGSHSKLNSALHEYMNMHDKLMQVLCLLNIHEMSYHGGYLPVLQWHKVKVDELGGGPHLGIPKEFQRLKM